MSDGFDDLIAKAKEHAETPPLPEEWGYRVKLDPGGAFIGRWRGETVDEKNDNRRIFLFWDESGAQCFSRTYAALEREIDRTQPTLGYTIVVYRGDDYTGEQGTGYSFGVETKPNDAELPADPKPDHDIPF